MSGIKTKTGSNEPRTVPAVFTATNVPVLPPLLSLFLLYSLQSNGYAKPIRIVDGKIVNKAIPFSPRGGGGPDEKTRAPTAKLARVTSANKSSTTQSICVDGLRLRIHR